MVKDWSVGTLVLTVICIQLGIVSAMGCRVLRVMREPLAHREMGCGKGDDFGAPAALQKLDARVLDAFC